MNTHLEQNQSNDIFTPPNKTSPPMYNEEQQKFNKSQLINFIGLIFFSLSSAILWNYEIFGRTKFPWFVPVITIFGSVWSIHYWLYFAWDEKDKKKQQKYYFYMHSTLCALASLTLILMWTHEPSSPWFVYPVGILCAMLSIHWTVVWCPHKWKWIVAQMFIYCIAISVDFSICYMNPEAPDIWVWIAVIYGGVLVLQGSLYMLLTWMIPRLEKNKVTTLSKLESQPLLNPNTVKPFLLPPKNPTPPSTVIHSSTDYSFDAGASDPSGAEVILHDSGNYTEVNALHRSSNTINDTHTHAEKSRLSINEIDTTKYITISESLLPNFFGDKTRAKNAATFGSPGNTYDIMVLGDVT